MSQKIKTSQTRQHTALATVGSVVDENGESVLSKIDAYLSNLVVDKSLSLSGGGSISVDSTGLLEFSSALSLIKNRSLAGGIPVSVAITLPDPLVMAAGDFLYADLDSGVATVASQLPSTAKSNGNLVVIANRIGSFIRFLNGQTIIVSDTTTIYSIESSDVSEVNSFNIKSALSFDLADDSTVGSDQNITVTSPITRLTGATLDSVAGFSLPEFGNKVIKIYNKTGNQITISHNSASADPGCGIMLPGGEDLILANDLAIEFLYSETDSNWISVGGSGSGGGGGGGFDTYYTQDMEGLANTAVFSTGNNAAFMGGGTLQGTLSLDESAPISGTKSLKYVQASGSVNDYFASPVIDIDIKQKNNTSGMTFYFEYDGNDNDGRFVVYDVTNSVELASEVNFVKVANSATRYSLSFYVPESCTQISWGYKVLVENIGKALIVDDVEMTMNPFIYKDLSRASRVIVKSYSSGNDWWEVYNDGWVRQGNTDYMTGTSFVFSPVSLIIPMKSSSYSARALRNSTFTGSMGANYVTVGNKTTTTISIVGSADATLRSVDYIVEGYASTSALATLGVIIGPASTSHVLTPSDTFSTDTAPLTYASSAQYNLTTLANAPIGTYITFTYAAGGTIRAQTTTRPTQTDASMNQNGMQIFTRAFNEASTAGNPTAFAVLIGKGLKGYQINLYKSPNKVTEGTLGFMSINASVMEGISIRAYSEVTGILYVDAGFINLGTNTVTRLVFSDLSNQTNGYLTINASRSLPLLAVPVPLVAYLKDVKPSGTNGGTFTAGAWQTRTLNTVEGDGSIVSLNANQFTLSAGKYEIEASAPAYLVDRHKIKLRNITDATDSIIGQAAYSGASGGTSRLLGTINLSTTKVFEIQHRSSASGTPNGMGVEGSFGVPEVFTQVKIVRLS